MPTLTVLSADAYLLSEAFDSYAPRSVVRVKLVGRDVLHGKASPVVRRPQASVGISSQVHGCTVEVLRQLHPR
jgi:hypothetical protein